VGNLSGSASPEVSWKAVDLIIIDVADTDAAQPRSVIVIDLADEETALKVAQEIAEKTELSVTVQDEDMLKYGPFRPPQAIRTPRLGAPRLQRR
jgi:hypothetical protein